MPKILAAVFNSPAVRKAFYALVLAVLGALGYSQLAGCTPSQIERAQSAVDEAQQLTDEVDCVQAAVRAYEANPPKSAEDAAVLGYALAAELKSCLSAPKPAPAADAGAR